jgi:L-amino acid N-acyltransferase YncA
MDAAIIYQEDVKSHQKRDPVTFAVEQWSTYAADAPSLWQRHWTEVALDHEAVPLDMDLARYAELDRLGMLHIVTARVRGNLIGYFTGVVSCHLHYASTLHCLVDLYYLEPLWRRGTTALRLFGTAHRTLKERGVVKILSGSKIHNALDMTRLFTFMGYKHVEKQFSKLL